MPASSLRMLSDQSLLRQLNALVRREHGATIDVLHHLNEVERRKLHRELGYSSMFKYCTERLRYSESAAGRRIRAARAMRRYPRVLELLTRREINLSTLDKIAGVVFERDDPSLFEHIRGKTQGEVDEIVAAYRPQKRLRDRVQAVYVQRKESAPDCVSVSPLGKRADSASASGAPHGELSSMTLLSQSGGRDSADTVETSKEHGTSCTDGYSRGGSTRDSAQASAGANSGGTREHMVKKYKYQFLAGEELKRALDQVRSLLPPRVSPDAPMEDVLAILVDEYLDRHCPRRRHARRQKKRAERDAGSTREKDKKRDSSAALERRPRDGAGKTKTNDAPGRYAGDPTPEYDGAGDGRRSVRARYIPAATRDQTLARAGYRCCYVGADGVHCSETRRLQIDHIMPVALGGSSDPDNLRALCPAHNIHEAERLLGREFMGRFT